MHGSYRQGAGRKPGFTAKLAEEARCYFSQRVSEEIESLASILIKKAKRGDIKALQILLDRAWGRPGQEIRLMEQNNQSVEINPRIQRLAATLNTVSSK